MDFLSSNQSFVNPCKVRTLVVPIGKWKKRDFLNQFETLRANNEVRLLDITPIDCPLFTPQAFPNGRVFYDFTISQHADALDLFLYDFEPFRKIFVIIGLVNDKSDPVDNMNILKERYPTVISHNLLYTDKSLINSDVENQDKSNVFHYNSDKLENYETILCDITRNFLVALNHYYSSYKHVTLRSPGAIGGNAVRKTSLLMSALPGNQSRGSGSLYNSNSTNTNKRLSSFEMTTNNIKRSASLKLSTSLASTDNKIQTRAQGRQYKILGNFQLLAGRVSDALNSFNEAVILLYMVRDLLWLGSALDGVAICAVILSYLQMPFKIPHIVALICPMESPNNSIEALSPRNSLTNSVQSPRNSLTLATSEANIDVDMSNLPVLVKAILDKALHYYDESLSHNSEYAPQIVYSQFLSRTLSFMLCCNSAVVQSQNVASSIINCNYSNKPLKDCENLSFSNSDVYSFCGKVLLLKIDDMELEEQSSIFSLLSKAYASLQLTRKQAFTLRLLLVSISSHAEGLKWQHSFQNFLDTVMRLYDIHESADSNEVKSNSLEWRELQKDIIELCLQISVSMKAESNMRDYGLLMLNKYNDMLSETEQKEILQVILKPLIQNLKIKEYWDPFILRGVTISRLETDSASYDTLRIPNENSTATAQKINPHEVFNPFKQANSLNLKTSGSSDSKPKLFLVDDRAEFSCTIQNPYGFDITISDIHLPNDITDYCELDTRSLVKDNPYVIGAKSVRNITLPIKIKKSTADDFLFLRYLRLSVLDLPLSRFDVYPMPQNGGIISPLNINLRTTPPLESEALTFKILPEQPELEVMNNGKVTGNSWMLLDGTKSQFTILIRNKSLSKSIDQLNVTAVTNIEHALKADYWKKMQPDDLNILESNIMWMKNECIKILNKPAHVQPNEIFELKLEIDTVRAPFEFESFIVVVEYGMQEEDKSCFYMKKLKIPYEVTLRRSIEVPNMDLIPLNHMNFTNTSDSSWIAYIQSLSNKSNDAFSYSAKDYMLLLLDFRNSWIDGIHIEVTYEDFVSKGHLVESNRNLRIIVPIKKIDVEKINFSNKPIPRIFKERQFLQSGMDENTEITMRECFWTREYILERLSCRWELSTDSLIRGEVDFRKYIEKFDNRTVANLYKGKLPFSITLSSSSKSSTTGELNRISCQISPQTVQRQHSRIQQTALLNFFIFEHFSSKLLPKSNRRLLYNGSLSQKFSTNSESTVCLDVIPIEPGCYEICVCISETESVDKVLQFNPDSILVEVN
ncbi:hypothetical protein J7298_01351 [Nakaseomyces glabratus]|nr:hypothetical protein J7298_01351 [Nakaseomyces glabratus]